MNRPWRLRGYAGKELVREVTVSSDKELDRELKDMERDSRITRYVAGPG